MSVNTNKKRLTISYIVLGPTLLIIGSKQIKKIINHSIYF